MVIQTFRQPSTKPITIQYLLDKIEKLLDQISPFWGPGVAFVTWFVCKRTNNTVRLSEVVMVSLIWGTILNIFALIYSLVLIPLAQVYFLNHPNSGSDFNTSVFWAYTSLAWFGVLFFALNVIFYLMIGFFEWFQKLMISLLVFIMKLFHLRKETKKGIYYIY